MLRSMCRLLVAAWVGIAAGWALAQQAPVRIDDPRGWFAGHDRARWIGRRVCVLPAGKSADDKAEEFAANLSNWQSSHPRVGEVLGRSAVILEVWYAGNRVRRFDDRKVVTPNLFWKLRFEDNGQVLWFKDDGVGPPHTLGFWNDLLGARRWVGDTVWVKAERFLSAEGDQAAIDLTNLEPLRVVGVDWGEFGNYPLRFFLETAAGRRGYVAVQDTADFAGRWHWHDPRRDHPDWTLAVWRSIVDRRLSAGMTAAMVRLSWGDPDSTAVHAGAVLWFYQGVNKRRYRIKLVDGRLVSVRY